MERRVEPIARLRQGHRDFGCDVSGIRAEDENSVAHQDRFLDVVRHHEHGLGGELVLDPEIEKIGPQGFGRQDVERRKRLVHQKQSGLADGRPGKADPLAHSARKLARIGGLKAVEADKIDCRHSPGGAPRQRDNPRASRPSSTLSRTVSQGYKAKDWNTTAIPSAGPANGAPRYSTSPELGLMRPPAMRSRVDFPHPERPRRPSISPSRE